MDHTFVDEKSLKSLEDYAVFLTSGMITLMTLQNIQVHAIKIGIMKEDMNERANTIIWDVRRQIKLYEEQLKEVLDLLPEDFTADAIIEKLKVKHIAKAREMTRKPKGKKC
jgi:hypothetical protein